MSAQAGGPRQGAVLHVQRLEDAAVLPAGTKGLRVDRERASALSLAVEVLGVERQRAARREPAVYLTPPDLLADVAEDVGEIRQLLIELVAGARRRVILVSPFFSDAAVQGVLAPLDIQVATPRVDLYLSLAHPERQRATRLIDNFLMDA